MHTAALIAVEQVERCAFRQIQERGVLEVSLHFVVRPGARLLRIVRQMLVERLIVLVLELRFGPGPERLGLIERLLLVAGLQNDRYAQMIRILAHQLTQLRRFEELLVLIAQMHDHHRAAIRLVVILNLVGALAVRIPAHRGGVGAFGDHRDAVRHDECRIEADAELSYQLGILGRVPAQALEEFPRAGARDGAQILDDFIPAHADTVVLDGQRARRGIRNQRDRQRIGAQQSRIGEGLEAQLLARVRGVRNQLAQENFLVRIQRMDDQSQHLFGFGLKLFYLRLGFVDHDPTPPMIG